jgi:hypothetical protein
MWGYVMCGWVSSSGARRSPQDYGGGPQRAAAALEQYWGQGAAKDWEESRSLARGAGAVGARRGQQEWHTARAKEGQRNQRGPAGAGAGGIMISRGQRPRELPVGARGRLAVAARLKHLGPGARRQQRRGRRDGCQASPQSTKHAPRRAAPRRPHSRRGRGPPAKRVKEGSVAQRRRRGAAGARGWGGRAGWLVAPATTRARRRRGARTHECSMVKSAT